MVIEGDVTSHGLDFRPTLAEGIMATILALGVGIVPVIRRCPADCTVFFSSASAARKQDDFTRKVVSWRGISEFNVEIGNDPACCAKCK